jgi:hypothetical protein
LSHIQKDSISYVCAKGYKNVYLHIKYIYKYSLSRISAKTKKNCEEIKLLLLVIILAWLFCKCVFIVQSKEVTILMSLETDLQHIRRDNYKIK